MGKHGIVDGMERVDRSLLIVCFIHVLNYEKIGESSVNKYVIIKKTAGRYYLSAVFCLNVFRTKSYIAICVDSIME